MAAPELTARILRRLLASGLMGRAERLLARVHSADFGPRSRTSSPTKSGP